jgi:hypothetical protein
MGSCKITKKYPSKKYYLVVRDMQTAFRFFYQEKELKKLRSITFAKILAPRAITAQQNRPAKQSKA